jgi:hypothetical protein
MVAGGRFSFFLFFLVKKNSSTTEGEFLSLGAPTGPFAREGFSKKQEGYRPTSVLLLGMPQKTITHNS